MSYVAGDFDCYEASRYTYDSTSGLLKTISNECPDSGSDVTTYIYDNKGYAVKMEVKRVARRNGRRARAIRKCQDLHL